MSNIELIREILESIIVELGVTGKYSERRDKRLNELYNKVKRLDVQKKVNCESATKQNDGTCLGYQYGEDDEPIEQCKMCKICSSPYEDLEVQDDK